MTKEQYLLEMIANLNLALAQARETGDNLRAEILILKTEKAKEPL